MDKKLYTVTAYSENQVGLLNQIATIFTRRRLNIESLSVSASAIEGVHKFTITTYSDEETVSKWKEIIDQVTANGSFSGTIDGQTIVIQDQTSYFNFLNKYIAAVESASEASADYNYWLNKQTVFNEATEFPDGSETDKANLIAEADKKVSLLVATTTQMIEIYNDIVGDYNNSGISSAKSASLITPAYVTSASAISNTMMILIIALAVVLAAAIGFVRVRGRYLASLDGKAVEDGAKTA